LRQKQHGLENHQILPEVLNIGPNGVFTVEKACPRVNDTLVTA
jgi:hypothetical protein